MRLAKGISQEGIAYHLNLLVCFIGHLESPHFRAKYNKMHLNQIAIFFNCSPKDFFPEKPLK